MNAFTRIALFCCVSFVCGVAHAARETLELEVAGIPRRVLLYVPDVTSKAPPALVLVYHGRGDDSEAFARAVKLHADWPEAIVAYPRGEWHTEKRQRGWQYRRGQYDDRDLLLTDALVATLEARFGTRPESTYAAGFSNGGHFVLLLMAERNAAFAAFAVIGSVLPEYRSSAPPKPLLHLFGRGEDPQYQDDWEQTIEALIRQNRTRGALHPFSACCKRQMADEDGAPLVFGTYNAGHIWPARGNEWLRAFFSDPWFRGEPPLPGHKPRPAASKLEPPSEPP